MPSVIPQFDIVYPGGEQTKCVLEQRLTWNIGRSENSHIVLDDDAASRRHAIIQKTDAGEYYLMDLGSRNGTFINGQRLTTPAVLNDGDEISIGKYKLLFRNALGIPTQKRWAETDDGTDDGTTGTKIVFTQQLVTVLVFDIRGFTQLTQQVSQDSLCKFIRRWFADASRVLKKHGAWALKYIGDAVMAVWRHEAGAERSDLREVLQSACEFSRISVGSALKYGLPKDISFGTGLNTGLASTGNSGSSDQADFTAFGDAVNAAFRIEAATREINCDVALGRTAADLLGGPPIVGQFFQAHEIHLKGYGIPTAVWAGSYADLEKLVTAIAINEPEQPTITGGKSEPVSS